MDLLFFGIVLGRNREGFGLFLWGVLTADESGVALDEDTQRQGSGSENGESHNHEGGFVFEVAESQSEADSSSVSSSSDDSTDGSSGGRINVWDNSVGCTLGGLDKEREEDHDGDGGSERVGLGKDQDQDTFGDQANSLGPETSTHTHLLVTVIGQESSKSTGEEIHESEDGGDGGSRFGVELELILEIEGGGIVHGQFDTEAAGVLDEQDPGVDVQGTLTERSSCRNLSHNSVLLEFGVVTLGGVIGDFVDHDTGEETNNGRNNVNSSPSLFGVTVVEVLEEREEGRTHDELCDTSTEVSPSTTESIGGSNDFLAEHLSGPVLAHDEGTSGESDEETKDGETGSIVDETGAGGRDGGKAQSGSHRNTGSPLVASRSHDESHQNGSSDTDNGGCPDLLLGQSQCFLDFTQKRSDCEPDEKGNEETPPRHVEGSHVGACERAELDGLGSVILVGIDLDPVLVVLLPLGGSSSINFGHGWMKFKLVNLKE